MATAPYPVQVHSYLPQPPDRPVQVYEHLPSPPFPTQQPAPENALVFIGGLGDGPHTIPYVRYLASHLLSSSQPSASSPSPSSSARYSVFEARLSSAFSAFGYASLAQDARELADLVRYLRRGLGRRKVVLMGHSTGCQDCLEYATRYLVAAADDEEVRVDGLVLQGPVSDREAIAMAEDRGEVEACLRVAEGMVKAGMGHEVLRKEELPRGWRGSPVTAYRWCSLAGVG